MKTEDEWYVIKNVEKVDTPSFAIYPDRIKENISTLKHFVHDVNRLRPHIKTHKSAEVTKLLLDSGIKKFKCATIAEAEMLAMAEAPDILLAYQPIGPKAQRFATLVKKYPRIKFSCLIDNIDSAHYLNTIFQAINYRLPVFIDLNTGMNRTGIQSGTQALELYIKAQKLTNIRPVGLHVYDGHIRDQDIFTRTQRCNDAYEKVTTLERNLAMYGISRPIIVAGGTPTLPIHARRADVECSPGTFIYWDKGYHDNLPEQDFIYAALIVTRIISKPTDDTICIDLGHKSIASENALANRVHFLNATNIVPVSHSEEHMVLRVKHKHEFKVGNVLYGVPYHVCPTCALYDTATVVKNHEANAQLKIESRSRVLTI